MEPFPEDITRFIEANLESVEHLEILSVLASDRQNSGTARTWPWEVQTQFPQVLLHLHAMEKRGLLTVIREDGTWYRFGPIPASEQQVERLLQLYNERPVTMIKMLYARAYSTLKNFADAFRLRKEE